MEENFLTITTHIKRKIGLVYKIYFILLFFLTYSCDIDKKQKDDNFEHLIQTTLLKYNSDLNILTNDLDEFLSCEIVKKSKDTIYTLIYIGSKPSIKKPPYDYFIMDNNKYCFLYDDSKTHNHGLIKELIKKNLLISETNYFHKIYYSLNILIFVKKNDSYVYEKFEPHFFERLSDSINIGTQNNPLYKEF